MRRKQHKVKTRFRMAANLFLFFFNKIYRIKANISKEIKNLDGPFLLLANHVGTFDPFIISYFIKKSVHFVASDAILRTPLLRFILNGMGVIPKKKNVKDTQVIKAIITVSRRGDAVGLFPEATRTWTGTSLPIEPSISKLVKLLNVPVVTVKLKGMNLFNPRWGTQLRKSGVEIDYNLAFSKEAIKTATLEEITEKIRQDLWHDEVDYQTMRLCEIQSEHRAEYISFVLFYCPLCKSIGKIQAIGNDFECRACGHKTHVNKYGFFDNNAGKPSPYNNIRDWYKWQEKSFFEFIQNEFDKNNNSILFSDEHMLIYRERNKYFELLGAGTMYFYIDRILIELENGNALILTIKDIETINPQFQEKIEAFYQGEAYRFVGKHKGVSGLKWEIATNAIWMKMGQSYKKSAYLYLV